MGQASEPAARIATATASKLAARCERVAAVTKSNCGAITSNTMVAISTNATSLRTRSISLVEQPIVKAIEGPFVRSRFSLKITSLDTGLCIPVRFYSGFLYQAGEGIALPSCRRIPLPRGTSGYGKGIREIWASPFGGKSRKRFVAFGWRSLSSLVQMQTCLTGALARFPASPSAPSRQMSLRRRLVAPLTMPRQTMSFKESTPFYTQPPALLFGLASD